MTHETTGPSHGDAVTPCTPSMRLDLGCYVLGALDPAQHERVSRHLRTCAGCRAVHRELSVLPGLLARLTETGLPVGPVRPVHRLRPGPFG